MLHNFCKDSAPRHVRDFYLARLCRAASAPPHPAMTPHPHPFPPAPLDDPRDDPAARFAALPRARPRGDDGRFVPRADEEPPVDNRDRKICGWCRTTTTSQWRVGPTNGSVEMGTLCNACGINYRRALAKSPGGTLNLDRLAEQMGHTRLSIQKALKRQRKLSAPPHQFKRTRPDPRPPTAYTHASTDRFGLPARLDLTASHSNLNMLLSEDAASVSHHPASASHHPALARPPPPPPPLHTAPLDTPVFPVSRSAPNRYLPQSPPLSQSSPLTQSIPLPAQSIPVPAQNIPLPAQSIPLPTQSIPLPAPVPNVVDYNTVLSPQQHAVTEQHVDPAAGHGRDDDQSRLPPFQAFIGDLERRNPM